MAAATAPHDEQEKLRSALLDTLRTQVAACSDLKATKKKLRSIECKRYAFQQAVTMIRQSAGTALEDYAKSICRTFCGDVYSRFPREVRDMIYGHIFRPNIIDVTAASISAEPPKRLGHWHYADFVGSDVHQELGEHYFRSTCFAFGPDMSCLDLMPKFRVMDKARFGYVPAYFAAKIQIDIDCGGCDIDCGGCDLNNSPAGKGKITYRDDAWGTSAWATTAKEKTESSAHLLSKLELLFGFQTGTKLVLRFTGSSHWEETHLDIQERLCNNIVPLISPTVQRYLAAGYHVRIALCADYGWGYNPDRTFMPDPVPSSVLAWKTEFARYKISEQKRLKEEEEESKVAKEAAEDSETAEGETLSDGDSEDSEGDE